MPFYCLSLDLKVLPLCISFFGILKVGFICLLVCWVFLFVFLSFVSMPFFLCCSSFGFQLAGFMVKPWIYCSFVVDLVINFNFRCMVFRVDSTACIYPLYNSCRLSEFLTVLSFAVRSSLNLSSPILSRFLWVYVILSVGGLGKAILNLINLHVMINGVIKSKGNIS